ncbi:hypothetical protein NQF87_03250 [Bombella sp. TMW 2.2559]|uniref:Lipoprotein n=1 Tax=Bombella dulcis TaxID=2967339 RepID=A0ABT3WDX5_9PROT|nr:hypothetical protein [Bombella dulcis]MCX5615992.1 hypothetical protein [Bombella dulcis]
MPAFSLSSRIFSRLVAGLGSLMLAGLLSGCEEADTTHTFAPACPRFDIPGQVADRITYDGKGLDAAHRLTSTHILAVQGDCRTGPQDEQKRPMTRVRISLNLQLERGPAATDDTVTVPYFVAIIQDGAIVDKKIFTETINLPPTVSISRSSTPLRFIDIPTGNNPQISPYSMAIGLQLNHPELDYNRSHLRAAQFHEHVQ